MKKESKKKEKIFIFDFESRNSQKEIDNNVTSIWLWDLCDFELNHIIGYTMDSFFEELKRIAPALLYSHNLKFDISFIIDYILKKGYKWVNESKTLKANQFTTIISDMGQFYTVKICLQIGKYAKEKAIISFRDSMKKITGTVKKIADSYNLPIKKGEIDYRKERDLNYIATPEEIEYIHNDTEIIARVMKDFYELGFTKMTCSSDSFNSYKKELGEHTFNILYPQLDKQIDMFIRETYRGGVSIPNSKIKNKRVNQEIWGYDVNSMYPSVMCEELLPYGEPVYFKGRYLTSDLYPLFVIHIFVCCKIKENKIPCIQIKNGISLFDRLEYLEDTKNQMQELFLTSVDYFLMIDSYDIYDIKYVDGYYFKGSRNLFKEYIKPIYEEKKINKGVKREICKIKLNSLYGKFALNPYTLSKYPFYDKEDKRVRYLPYEQVKERKSIYPVVSSFITANARKRLFTYINNNYDTFLYCDTDSVFLTTDKPNKLPLGNELGELKIEHHYLKAKFIRSKCYIGLNEDDTRDKKCAGLPEEAKKQINEENFKIGSVFDGKLIPKIVDGGTILVDGTYTIYYD